MQVINDMEAENSNQGAQESREIMATDRPNEKASKWFKTPPYSMKRTHKGNGEERRSNG